MSENEVIRAWKDRRARRSVASDGLPAHPAGSVEIADERLSEVAAGLLAPQMKLTVHEDYCNGERHPH